MNHRHLLMTGRRPGSVVCCSGSLLPAPPIEPYLDASVSIHRPGPDLVTENTELNSAWTPRHLRTMELDDTSPPTKVVHFLDRSVPEAFDRGLWPSKDPLPVSPEFSFAPLYTTQSPHIQHFPAAINTPSSKQPCPLVVEVEKSTPQPDQIKAKTACLRCRGKKSRCSGQRPCEGCSNDGLDCLWGDEEAKLKRGGRKTKLAESKRKASKSKNSPLQVRSACTRCQHRKAKCTGTRPACAYCVERELECTYDVAEGETRTNDLKRRLKDSVIRVQAFGRILAVMREGSIYQATEVLARLRLGDTPRDVLQSLPMSISSGSPQCDNEQSELSRRLSR
jgi:hypothetical protein